MKGSAKVVTHRPGDKNCTRRLDRGSHIFRYGDGDRGYTEGLNLTLNQSNGLMADRSSWGQQSGIRSLVFNHRFGNVTCHRPLKFVRIHVVADETEKIGTERA
jgi:hypothetical protein